MTKKDYVKQIFSLTSNSADQWMRTMPSTGSNGRRVKLTEKNYNRWSEKQLAGRTNTIRTSIRKKQKRKHGFGLDYGGEGYEFSDQFENRYERGHLSFEEMMLERGIQDKERGLNIKNWRERAMIRQNMPTIYEKR
jgi:hypothetical protein